ncbi:MAG: ATP-binding protein [Prochlorothrix sp.]
MTLDLRSTWLRAQSLVVYAEVLHQIPGQLWLKLGRSLLTPEPDPATIGSLYGRWFRALATIDRPWTDWILNAILQADNPWSRAAQFQDPPALPPALTEAAAQDLRTFQAIAHWDPAAISAHCQTLQLFTPPLPAWYRDPQPLPAAADSLRQATDWDLGLEVLAHHYRSQGIGIWGQFWAFRWSSTPDRSPDSPAAFATPSGAVLSQGGDRLHLASSGPVSANPAGSWQGVAHPDPVRLEELVGYEQPKAQLIQNTEFLLAGQPALNVLLYGSRGAGKSSLVKALVPEYGPRGLRLLEVMKQQLGNLPQMLDRLRNLPQKFIIFVDDLSFEEDDEAFKALKVVLEGNVVAHPANVVVYATSNRRHLVREYFEERPRPQDADEIHRWDTVQEKLSFSDRFGLTLTFEPPDQDTYLAMVHHRAARAGLRLTPEDLTFRALQWATRHNGRSGRTAQQFIDWLTAEQSKAR